MDKIREEFEKEVGIDENYDPDYDRETGYYSRAYLDKYSQWLEAGYKSRDEELTEQHTRDLQVLVIQQAKIKKLRDALENGNKIAKEYKVINKSRKDWTNAGAFRDILKINTKALKESE